MSYTNEKLQEYLTFLHGKTASVIGVGISNIPLIGFLLDAGVKVTARDKKPMEKLAANPKLDVEGLQKRGVTFVTGDAYLENITDEIVFKSPGVRYDKPEILEAVKNGALITSEMEAFLSLCPSKVIAVTGSNGKTTTTTLISEILKNAGHRVFVGGNIGRPLLSQISEITPEDFTVLELSSFQLHTVNRFENKGLPFAHISFPTVGVITNISPNHLDWHTDMDEYADSKRAVFTHMAKGGTVVTNRISDDYCARYAKEAEAEGRTVRLFSAHDGEFSHGACLANDGERILIDGKCVLTRSDIILPGLHNVENYMTAILATRDYVTDEAIVKTARTFPGVPHRMEFVAKKNGVTFYNGSIDSSPSRTVAALSCFGEAYDGKICLILGGYDKHIPFEPIAEPILKKRIRCFIAGATADAITSAIKASPLYTVDAPLTRCVNFDDAVKAAAAAAKDGDIVLLSPACASFDEFDNFEQRGERYKKIVEEIK